MMELMLVTGGVRSGKSRWAQGEALARGGEEVTVIATAEPVDDEMRERIAAHRRDRPAGWHTIEAPARAGEAILAAGTDTVLLDCVTVLTGMAIGRSGADAEAAALDAMAAEIDGILDARAARTGLLIVVTNEVGWSVHPPTALGRWYQDGLGIANQRLAAAADRVVLMVSGLELRLK
ncbi:MAG: bifunctional adenosylcobinamide kinase/adenosylcobinamide-phosphate guanylyltransferase [Gemmatimonadota bacterium]|uniref:bifunctional adenosylcobinamide kinase/adenosylcobinamide-phosphate guanylyltransferase n=1 Tax=Candidatus Palauibacter scopulicola TaxID=3056741 RepID=UPI00238B5DDD|nr:bifunctional adenosylcobinamide kinase/adenosylcobinamide-phosphate guanylyltransferase [Candidatus Palauibacter scopulicola]MDE2664486.1 bifunctional adenosylcobinamide kinase/adenosylcobinamide-phosphate guanylyltransferase [Candidatus Palauibacter scopulicola]